MNAALARVDSDKACEIDVRWQRIGWNGNDLVINACSTRPIQHLRWRNANDDRVAKPRPYRQTSRGHGAMHSSLCSCTRDGGWKRKNVIHVELFGICVWMRSKIDQLRNMRLAYPSHGTPLNRNKRIRLVTAGQRCEFDHKPRRRLHRVCVQMQLDAGKPHQCF
jgi:hypothetical protein